MTKKGRRGHNGSLVDGRITTAYVRYLGTYSTVISGSTQFGQNIHPLNFGARAVELCDLFEECRIVSAKARCLATYSSATSNPVMTIIGATPTENLTAAPTLAAQLAQFDVSHVSFLNQTIPLDVRMPKELIYGQKPWYSANNAADSPAVWFISGMSISTGLAVAGTVQVLWELKIQFKGNSDPSVSISRRLKREDDELLCDDDRSDSLSVSTNRTGSASAPPAVSKSSARSELIDHLLGRR